MNNLGTALEIHRIADEYLAKGDFTKSITEYNKVLNIYESHKYWTSLLNAYNGLISSYFYLSEYDKASELVIVAESVFFSNVANDEDVERYYLAFADLLNNLSILYIVSGLYELALLNGYRALIIKEITLPIGDSSIIESYCLIGGVYGRKDDYIRQQYYYKLALENLQKSSLIDEKLLAVVYNNLGHSFARIGDFERAITYHEKALAIRREVLGEEHIEYFQSLNNLGYCFQNLKFFDKAVAFHKMALQGRLKVLGNFHTNVALSYNNLGIVYELMMDYTKAIYYYEKAKNIGKKISIKTNYIDIPCLHMKIGRAYLKVGDKINAEKYLLSAWKAQKNIIKLGGIKIAEIFETLHQLGKYYTVYGYYKQSIGFHEELFRRFDKALLTSEIGLSRANCLIMLTHLSHLKTQKK